MSVENVLCHFPKEEKPEIYTGLFEKRVADRALSNKPNKSLHGVSATRYAEALDVKVGVDKAGDDVALFDMFHGYCDGFAYYLAKKHPEWSIVTVRRDGFWKRLVHAFCVFWQDGHLCYADARGITDDPVEFFMDYSCGKEINVDVLELSQADEYFRTRPEMILVCQDAYQIVYGSTQKTNG